MRQVKEAQEILEGIQIGMVGHDGEIRKVDEISMVQQSATGYYQCNRIPLQTGGRYKDPCG